MWHIQNGQIEQEGSHTTWSSESGTWKVFNHGFTRLLGGTLHLSYWTSVDVLSSCWIKVFLCKSKSENRNVNYHWDVINM